MKKFAPLFALAAALLLAAALNSAALAAGGTQSDPLISLSYLNGAFWEELVERVDRWVSEATQPLFDAAANSLTGGQDSAWTVSASFAPCGGEAGDTITLDAGSGLLWVSGSATAQGVLADATGGCELAASEPLTAGHRYLADGETVITVSSRTAHWMAEGRWTTTSDGISVRELPFTDVTEEQWFFENVLYVYENGLMVGTDATLFSPDLSASRAMVVTILWRLEGSPQAEPAAFSDLTQDWYAGAVGWASANGIVNGYDSGAFGPDDPVTREQLTSILYRYASFKGRDVSDEDQLSAFTDADAISPWARPATSWAASTGILLGADGAALPQNSATRAQLAAVLQRLQTWMDQ